MPVSKNTRKNKKTKKKGTRKIMSGKSQIIEMLDSANQLIKPFRLGIEAYNNDSWGDNVDEETKQQADEAITQIAEAVDSLESFVTETREKVNETSARRNAKEIDKYQANLEYALMGGDLQSELYIKPQAYALQIDACVHAKISSKKQGQ